MSVLCLDNTSLERLVWEDIVSDGLDAVTSEPSASEDTTPGAEKISSPEPTSTSTGPCASPTASVVMSEHNNNSNSNLGAAPAAAATSGAATSTAAGQQEAVSGAAEGPFAAMRHQQHLSRASSGCIGLPRASSLSNAPSLVTFKTRALAAAAGSLRTGAVGSNLRLAALMSRSNSGGLADTLLSEHARAESGLLTIGLPRSDSVPELGPGPSADLQELFAAHELEFAAGVPAAAGMPSLSMLFGDAAMQAAAAAAGAGGHGDASLEPAWAGGRGGSRMLGRPPSFSANSAAVLYAAGAQLPSRPQMFGGVQQPDSAAAAPSGNSSEAIAFSSGGPSVTHSALRPPTLLNFRQMMMQSSEPAPAAPAAAAAPGRPPSAFEGFSLPSFSKVVMERQDTFDVLLRQVDQELCAEAELKQYAALQYDTIDVQLPTSSAAGAGAPTYVSPFGGAAVVEPAVAGVKRRSVFDGRSVLLPADPTAASAVLPHGGGGGAAAAAAGAAAPPPLDTTGPSFGCWVPPGSPAAAVGRGGAATPRAGAQSPMPACVGAAAASSAGPVGPSPFALPDSAGLLAGDSAAGGGGGGGGAAPMELVQPKQVASALGKQEVARYSRVITCKTYLKRLNITQPMAEHLLPPHDLSLPATAGAARTSCDGGSDDDAGAAGSKKNHYEQLFKDQISVVDEAGTSFRVQYEGVSCNAQKHLRLTSGWRDFIRAHNVAIGDTVVFERRGDERTVLYVTVVRGAEGGGEEEQEGSGGPAPKKRRMSRKQAVRRLE